MSDPIVEPYSVPCVYCQKPVERPGWQTPEARANPKLMDCVDCGNKKAARKKDQASMRYSFDHTKRVWVDHSPNWPHY